MLLQPLWMDPLSSVFNKSFLLGQFPNKMKIAKITSAYKNDDKFTVNDNCPISILLFAQNSEEAHV